MNIFDATMRLTIYFYKMFIAITQKPVLSGMENLGCV